MSRQDLIERVIEHLDLGGNALLTKVVATSLRGGKVPVELWPIDPSGLKPIPSRAEFISGYEYWKGDQRIVIPAADVIHFSYSDPSDPYWGMSPLQAAASAVDTDVAAAKWNRIGFQNRAIPEILFTLDEPLSRDDWEKARDELNKAYAGSENGRQPWVVGAGAKVEMLSWKPTEMDFIEGRKLTREEILAAYQVPPPIAGIYADATLANLDASRKVFWSDTIVPLMDNLEAAINRALVPYFGTRETLKVCYDTSAVEVLRANVDLKSQTYERLVKNGVPPTDAVEMLDMDLAPIEGGDVGYIPATLIPLPLAADLAHETLRMSASDRTNLEDLGA
jgi:HK97 family phage portal protein